MVAYVGDSARIARRLPGPLILLALAGAVLLSPAPAAADPGDQASFTGSCSGTSCPVHGNNTGSTELFFAVLRWANGGAPLSASASDPNAACYVGQFPGGQWATVCQWSGATGGWAPGEPLDITTSFPADGLPSGLQEGCVSSMGNSDFCLQFDIGSSAEVLLYDLDLKLGRGKLVQVKSVDPDDRASRFQYFSALWDVRNDEKAGRPSEPATYNISVTGSPHLAALVNVGSGIDAASLNYRCPPDCTVPALAPGGPYNLSAMLPLFVTVSRGVSPDPLFVAVSRGGSIELSASVACNKLLEFPIPGCDNNLWPVGGPSLLWIVHLANDSKVKNANARGLSGQAGVPPAKAQSAGAARDRQASRAGGEPGRAVKKVEVAILRLASGLKPQKGPVDRRASAAAAKRSCEWVKNPKAQFARRPASDGVCDSHVWLKAHGTSKWEFELKKPLPPGTYVAYSRATTKEGAQEQSFTAKDGNLKKFTVR